MYQAASLHGGWHLGVNLSNAATMRQLPIEMWLTVIRWRGKSRGVGLRLAWEMRAFLLAYFQYAVAGSAYIPIRRA